MIELYHDNLLSVCAQKVRIVLEEKTCARGRNHHVNLAAAEHLTSG